MGSIHDSPKIQPEAKEDVFGCRLGAAVHSCLCAACHSGLVRLAGWLHEAATRRPPTKSDQNCPEACLCLLVGRYYSGNGRGLMVGNMDTGYIVVPASNALYAELQNRCAETGRLHHE